MDKTDYIPPCTDNPDLFYSEKRAEVVEARAICVTCKMVEECLNMALAQKKEAQYGVWGGATPSERIAMMRNPKLKVIHLNGLREQAIRRHPAKGVRHGIHD